MLFATPWAMSCDEYARCAGQVARFRRRAPALPEQRGIAATLGALDDKIDSNRRIVATAMQFLDLVSARAGQERGARRSATS